MRKHAPATLRNREAIAERLQEVLPITGTVLEIASGSGEHCAWFAKLFPGHIWQPSDADPTARASIAAWCEGLANVRPPLFLDASDAQWPIEHADAVLCINMIHISPWEATLGLMAGTAGLLSHGAPLILYGPFLRDAVETAESNLAFDQSLRIRDAHWGLRRLEAVSAAAKEQGLVFDRLFEMPANNLLVVYRRD